MDGSVPISAVPRAIVPATRRSGRGEVRLASTGLAAAIHVLAIVAAIVVFPRRPPPPPEERSVPVVFQPPAPPAQPALPEMIAAVALQPSAVIQANTLAEIAPRKLLEGPSPAVPYTAPLHAAPPHAPPLHATLRQTAAAPPRDDARVPAIATRPQAARPAADPALALSSSKLAAWEARVHQAVQDALIYPNAARLMHREGRTRVRFDYNHGSVVRVAVVESSQFAALDRAATDAVARAAMPAPPPELSGQDRELLLWVSFTLADPG